MVGCSHSVYLGIEGFVRMNTAGAGIYDVRHAYTMLWILTGVYFVTTCLVYRYQIWKDKNEAFRECSIQGRLKEQVSYIDRSRHLNR